MGKAKATAEAKAPQAVLSDRFAGKRICLQGRFAPDTLHKLEAFAKAHGGTICDDIDAKVDWVVVPDASAPGKGVNKSVLSLNAKGAAVQIIGHSDFNKQIEPTDEEVIQLLRQGQVALPLFSHILVNQGNIYSPSAAMKRRIVSESFAGCDLDHFSFPSIAFDGCDFTGASLEGSLLAQAKDCAFDKVHAPNITICDASDCTFKGANLQACSCTNGLANVDFTGADMQAARLQPYTWQQKPTPWLGLVFRSANLSTAVVTDAQLVQPDFEGANLSGVGMDRLTIEAGNFRKADLSKATLNGCKLQHCDFTDANLRGAHLAEADLTGAIFNGANLTGCNLRGANLQGVDLAKARGYDPAKQKDAVAGPATLELDNVVSSSKRIRFSFMTAEPIVANHRDADDARTISADTVGLQWGWGVRTPITRAGGQRQNTKLSDELITAARLVGDVKIQFETLEVTAHKAPLKGAELRDLVTRALCEAFSQEAPDAEKIGTALKSKRAKEREEAAEAKKQREEYKKREEELKKKETKQIEKKIAKAVGGKVTDIAGFLKALELRADVAKISKATKMLKAEKFQLFNDIADTHLQGVVKSQTDADLVYACRIESDGQYACCTQNLNICGGLRGSICKHLLVLIIGLVKAGQLDPGTIDGWVSKSRSTKAELDKEVMGEIFIRYKGAEAGEVDWRPTETVPEDYYAL